MSVLTTRIASLVGVSGSKRMLCLWARGSPMPTKFVGNDDLPKHTKKSPMPAKSLRFTLIMISRV